MMTLLWNNLLCLRYNTKVTTVSIPMHILSLRLSSIKGRRSWRRRERSTLNPCVHALRTVNTSTVQCVRPTCRICKQSFIVKHHRFKFKLIYLRSFAKQVIQTYINRSRPLIPDGIHLIFERGLRGKRSQTCPYILSAKQWSIWYHFITSLVWRGRGSNPWHHAYGANALTTEPPLRSTIIEQQIYSLMKPTMIAFCIWF